MGDYSHLEPEAREVFDQTMDEEGASDEDREFLWDGFLDNYVEHFRWDNRHV